MCADPDRPVPPGRRGRPGHDRDTVLRRAVDLFIAQGYDATSVGDLARSLGVTKSAIYHHVESKEALLAAALDEALDALDRAVDVAGREAPGAEAVDRLRTVVEESVVILAEHLPAVTLLLRVRGNSPVEQAALARRREIDARLAALVREAAADGALRQDIDPDLVSRLVFGTVNSLVEWYRPGGPVNARDVATAVSRIVFDGLRQPEPGVPPAAPDATPDATPDAATGRPGGTARRLRDRQVSS